MNAFNRVVIVVLLILAMVIVSVVLVIPHAILSDVGAWMTRVGEQLWEMELLPRLAGGIALALVFDVLAIFLIYLELRPKRKRFIRVQDVSGGMATLSIESIIQQLQYRLDPVAGVINVKSAVRAKGDKVAASVDVTVGPGSNVPEMASRLVEVVQRTLTSELGLQVAGDPQVRLKVASPPEGGRLPAPPRPVVSPSQPVRSAFAVSDDDEEEDALNG